MLLGANDLVDAFNPIYAPVLAPHKANTIFGQPFISHSYIYNPLVRCKHQTVYFPLKAQREKEANIERCLGLFDQKLNLHSA